MIKVVLKIISDYWIHLFHIPQAIINKIDSIIAKFLWSRVGVVQKYHPMGLNNIANSIQKGRWGIIESHTFNLVLLVARV